MLPNIRLTATLAAIAALVGAVRVGIDELGWSRLPLTTLTGSILAAVTFVMGFMLSSLIADYKEAERLPVDIATAIKNLADDGEYFADQLDDYDDTALRANLVRLCDQSIVTITQSVDHDLDQTLRALLANISDLDRAGAPPNHTVRMKGDVFLIRRALERTRYIRKIVHLPTASTLVISLALIAEIVVLFTDITHRVSATVLTAVFAYLYLYLLAVMDIVENPFRERRGKHDDISLYLLRETHASLAEHPSPN